MTSSDIRGRRFPWWLYAVALFFILGFALWPLFAVLVSGMIADANGCVLNEAQAHACWINGEDWGRGLYTAFVMGWFMIATIPIGVGALLAWLLVLSIHLVRYWRRRDAVR